MNMTPIDWKQAQNALIKLVQILTDLTIEGGVSSSEVLSKRFFTIPSHLQFEPIAKNRPVRVLTNLDSLRKELSQWMDGSLPVKESLEKVSKDKQSLSNQIALKAMNSQKSPESFPAVSKQAKLLIKLVHAAIGELSSSKHLRQPNEESLKQALTKIKPQLDQMIEVVSEHEVQTLQKEHLNQLSLPNLKDGDQKAKLNSVESIQLKEITKPVSKTQEKRKDSIPSKNESEKFSSFDRPKVQAINPFTGRLVIMNAGEEGAVTQRPTERTSLSAAPYQAAPKNQPTLRKKKKKKGFWSKEREEKEEEDLLS